MRDLEKKISIYNKYKAEQGIEISKKEQNILFSPTYDTSQAETLMSIQMFKTREHAAATVI